MVHKPARVAFYLHLAGNGKLFKTRLSPTQVDAAKVWGLLCEDDKNLCRGIVKDIETSKPEIDIHTVKEEIQEKRL